MRLYRGTQRPQVGGLHRLTSWTVSLPVAVIYSARPRDGWRGPRFMEGSTIHEAELPDTARVLHLCGGSPTCSLADVMKALRFGHPHGLTRDEARRILNYLHNRLVGRTHGGQFLFKALDEDGDAITDEDVPFSLSQPETVVSVFREDVFDDVGPEAAGDLFFADTYVFADSPSVRKAARRLGYDALGYQDIFEGTDEAADRLLGCDVLDLEEVDEAPDINAQDVAVHQTIRPLHPEALVPLGSVPTVEVLPQVSCPE